MTESKRPSKRGRETSGKQQQSRKTHRARERARETN